MIMKRNSITLTRAAALIAAVAAAAIINGCGGGGGGGGSASGFSSALNMKVDLSRIAAAIPAGTNVSAEVSAISYDTIGNPTMMLSVTTPLTLDPADGKYKGDVFLNGLTSGTNVICSVRVMTNGATYAYLGSIVDTLAEGVAANVNISATSTVYAETTLFYAIARSEAMPDSTKINPTVKSSISNSIAALIASNTISQDDYILASRLPGNPFLPSTWDAPITRKYENIVKASSMGDVIPPRVIDYSPKNGAVTSVYDRIPFVLVFSESMDTSFDLNATATLQASGFNLILQRRATGSTYTFDAATTLRYGSFSWGTTTVPNDTLTFTLYSNQTLGRSGLAFLGPNIVYDVLQRSVSSYLKDSIGNTQDTRAAFPTTDFPSTGYFTTAP